MKKIVKILNTIFALCILLMTTSITAQAASGRISMSDLVIEASEEFAVKIKTESYDVNLSAIEITLKYDNTVMELIGNDYELTQEGYVKVVVNDLDTLIHELYIDFVALKYSASNIDIVESKIMDAQGEVFQILEGSSSIVIEGGEEREAYVALPEIQEELVEVEQEEQEKIIQVAGKNYHIIPTIMESVVPVGYTINQKEINGEKVDVALGDTSDVILVYLEDLEPELDSQELDLQESEGLEQEEILQEEIEQEDLGTQEEEVSAKNGRFFCYNEESDTYFPYVQIAVSDSTYIVFLSEDYEYELPENYVKTSMQADGFDFPAWEDVSEDGYYLIYARSSKGKSELYRYDVYDQSYQRYQARVVEDVQVIENVMIRELVEFIELNLHVFLLIVVLFTLILLLLTITFGVKLFNRNKEIEDIYDECGITAGWDMENKINHVDLGPSHSQVEEIMFDKNNNYMSNKPKSNKDNYYDVDDSCLEEYEQDEKVGADSSKDQEMLDDGMTQEFNIALANKTIQAEGYIDFMEYDNNTTNDYANNINANTQQNTTNTYYGHYDAYDYGDDDFDENDFDESMMDEFYEEESQRSTKKEVEKKNKNFMNKNKNDDIDFIEL